MAYFASKTVHRVLVRVWRSRPQIVHGTIIRTYYSSMNSAKRFFGRKSIKTIYTLSIFSFVIQDYKTNLSISLWFKEDNFIFWTLSVTSAISPVSVASFSIMKKWSKSLRCWSASDIVRCRGVFSSWSSPSSSEAMFIAWLVLDWYNLFNSFLSSLLSLFYRVGIYLTSRCCQIIVKNNKIFNSEFVVFTKLSKKTLKFFI